MLKKLLFFVMIISCCFINMSCDKRVQTGETDTYNMTPIPSTLDITISNEGIESNPIIITVTPGANNGVKLLGLDSETEDFLYGNWEVEKLLCFADSYNDASEYPTGQKIIGDIISIKKDLFDSRGLENYANYQYISRDPFYEIISTTYDADSFYRVSHINLPDLNSNDKVKYIWVHLSSSNPGLPIPLSFCVINYNRLVFVMEATCFEMKKVDDLDD